MKIFSFLIAMFLFVSQAQAGLFEYTLGESTRINSTKYESADIVESFKIPSVRQPQNSYSPNSYSSNSFNTSLINTKSYNSYSPNISRSNTSQNNFHNSFYTTRNNNIPNTSGITSEMQNLIAMANYLRGDISKIRNLGIEYNALRFQLEQDLKNLEVEIEYLSQLRSQITLSNRNTTSAFNNNFRSQRVVEYYRKYGYDYDQIASSYYFYNEPLRQYERKSEWADERLRPRDEGYIYIQ